MAKVSHKFSDESVIRSQALLINEMDRKIDNLKEENRNLRAKANELTSKIEQMRLLIKKPELPKEEFNGVEIHFCEVCDSYTDFKNGGCVACGIAKVEEVKE